MRDGFTFDRSVFYDHIRKIWGRLRQGQVSGLENLLSFGERDPRVTIIPIAAYMLATVKHETAHTYQPIYERGPKAYFNKYDGRRSLGNTQPGDGYRYRGRGYVQITGRANYEKLSRWLVDDPVLGVEPPDLETYPDRALEPEMAYRILSLGMNEGLFTGRPLSRYVNETRADYYQARRVVNALVSAQATAITRYALVFEKALRLSIALT